MGPLMRSEVHDKQSKKAHLGTTLKANPFGDSFHVKEIVLEKSKG